ncbi:MAG: hypothetical protein ACFFCQ_03940 [Promethearchaeota archaeon]
MRALESMTWEDVTLLAKNDAEKMLQEIPNTKFVDVNGVSHVRIVFHPHGGEI